jgi:predicted MFS family arabinose efflux permease
MTLSRKLTLLTTLYLSQGLPYGFFTQALPALMRQEGVSLEHIGLANLLALPWAIKFLYAPLVDHFGSERFGRRRSFILPLQGVAVVVLVVLASFDPRRSLVPLLVGMFVSNALAASQDIATDALAVDLLAASERGWGNGIQVAGYRVGMILGGGALLAVCERLGWARSFGVMALTLALATIPIGLYREPPKPAPPPWSGLALSQVREWGRRPGLWGWLVLLLVFKTGESLATGMLRPFLVDQGLSLGDLGVLLGTVGFTAGLVGALLGGAWVTRLGRRTALATFGLLQSLALALYAAAGSVSRSALYGIVGFEHLASGMATAALFTTMMDVCRPDHAATDYTLQACAVVVATGAGAALSGYSAHALGYGLHFAACALLSLAGATYAALYRGGRGTFQFLPAGA